MKESDFRKAKELFEKRDEYKELARQVDFAIRHKKEVDKDIKERMKNGRADWRDKNLVSRFFRIRLFNKYNENAPKTPTVGLLPHWELAHEIQMYAEPELIELIHEWLENKVKSLDEQIAEVGQEGTDEID